MVKSEESVSLCEPLRVSQSDAAELDSHLLDVLTSQLKSVFKLFQPYYFIKFEQEIGLILKIAVWHLSINNKNATLAQQLFSLQYINNVHSTKSVTSPWMTRKQKRLYLFLDVIVPWLLAKYEQIRLSYRKNELQIKISKILKLLELALKMSQIVNFLVFLTQGKQQFLMERILGIRLMYPRPQAVRQISYELSEREHLWQGFAELLAFIIPISNNVRLKRVVRDNLLRPLKLTGSDDQRISESDRLKTCPVCRDWPTNPHQGRCNHVFCYYCISSNFRADPGFRCPTCETPIEHKDNITPLPVLLDLRDATPKERKDERTAEE